MRWDSEVSDTLVVAVLAFGRRRPPDELRFSSFALVVMHGVWRVVSTIVLLRATSRCGELAGDMAPHLLRCPVALHWASRHLPLLRVDPAFAVSSLPRGLQLLGHGVVYHAMFCGITVRSSDRRRHWYHRHSMSHFTSRDAVVR